MPLSAYGTVDLMSITSIINQIIATINLIPTALSFTALTTNGAIPPSTPAKYIITKAGVLADTLAAPVAGTDDGKVISFKSSTAFAHTITATGLFQTGSANVNVATFAAFAGAGFAVTAYNGKWIVGDVVGVTFT